MRKILFTVFVLFFSFCYSQPYLTLLEEGNAWSVRFFDLYTSTTFRQFNIGETVLLNNTEYKNIYINSISSSCFIREENGIVYLLNSSNIEKIILDFTLEVGDIFFYESASCLYGTQQELEVLSISNQFIAGADRKVLELHGWSDTQYWIEGIGSTLGGLYVGESNIEGGSDLNCFYHNGEAYLFNNATQCVLSLEDYSKNQIILYPNPVSNTSILQLPETAGINRIKIFDLSGKLIKEESIIENHLTIDAMNYASGLYFYQVFSGKTLIKTERFLIN